MGWCLLPRRLRRGCALKACIAKKTLRHDFPPDPSTARDYYTHNIEALLRASHLKAVHDGDNAENISLKANWAIVKDWNEASRYNRWSRAKARDLINAITSEPDGVLAWIKQRW